MKIKDLTNQRYDKLLVLGIDEDNKYNSSGKLLWKCQCDCGNICYKTRDSLERPSKTAPKACTKACGAALPLGSKFGYLTIIQNIFNEKQPTQCLCQCDCGEKIIIPSDRIKNGTTKSCGCYQRQRMSQIGKQFSVAVDLTNQRFGKLIALRPTTERKYKSIVWECQCDCGNKHYVSVCHLKSGNVVQCPTCTTISKGEEKIKLLLTKANIPFVQEKTFSTCRFPETNALLRFDFYVDNTYLIEFDGIQHFKEIGWNNANELKATQQRDNFKNEWCQQNNIPLIRIPYTDLNSFTVEDLKLENNKYLI